MRENLSPSEQIGLRLKILRVEHTFSTEEVARMTNLTRHRVANLERGSSEQPLYLIIRLSLLYGVSLNYIITGKNH